MRSQQDYIVTKDEVHGYANNWLAKSLKLEYEGTKCTASTLFEILLIAGGTDSRPGVGGLSAWFLFGRLSVCGSTGGLSRWPLVASDTDNWPTSRQPHATHVPANCRSPQLFASGC